jgi:alpha-tubulin suppressor-like RCC1 family protein
MALLHNGKVMTWGASDEGQLGNGHTSGSGVPVEVCAVGQTVAPEKECTSHLEHVAGIAAGYEQDLVRCA